MTNLNKENFWNPLMEKYPASVKLFCDWIDEYKEDVFWDELFLTKPASVKFHHVPYEFQIGILCSFFKQYQMFIIRDESFNEFEIKETIRICFEQLNEKLVTPAPKEFKGI